MCVIAIAEKTRPTPEQVAAMFEQNSDGCGFAWREKKGNETRVKWEKGLFNLETAQKLCAELPLPFIAHFRIQTVGGKRAALCHPFPVLKEVPLDLKGSTNGFVLFHNGHWNSWRNSVLEAVWKTGFKIPSGKWSDSRAMAWSAAHFGVAILEFIDEKSVVISPDKIELTGKDWNDLDEKGIWFSNTNWVHRLKKVGVDNLHNRFPDGASERTVGLGGPNIEGWKPTSVSSHLNKYCKHGPCVQSRLEGMDYCKKHQDERDLQYNKKVKTGDDLAIQLLADPANKGGGPAGDSPFDQLANLWQKGDISKKQYKKVRKKMERLLHKRNLKQVKSNKRQKRLGTPHKQVSALFPMMNSNVNLPKH